MELPILLKEKLEQEIDEIELKKLKQSAQNISEKYRDKSSNKMSTRLIASREDAVAYAVSRMPATYGAVCFALKHSLEMMPYAEITSLLDVGAGTGTATWAVNELLKIESNICVENEDYMLNLGKKLMKNEIDNVQWIKKNIITDNIEGKADLVISSYVLNEVRLMNAYFVTCTGYDVDEDGNVTCVYATYDPESRGGNSPDGRKVRGTIHWVSVPTAKKAEIRLYENIVDEEKGVYNEDGSINVNPNSLTVIKEAYVEPELEKYDKEDSFQFMRTGYFCLDSKDSTKEHMVFNRIVSLKSSYKPN